MVRSENIKFPFRVVFRHHTCKCATFSLWRMADLYISTGHFVKAKVRFQVIRNKYTTNKNIELMGFKMLIPSLTFVLHTKQRLLNFRFYWDWTKSRPFSMHGNLHLSPPRLNFGHKWCKKRGWLYNFWFMLMYYKVPF